MAKTDPKAIAGPWTEGFTLDWHTVSSVPVGTTPGGHTQFATTRTELGELVYQLKYGGKKDGLDDIVTTAQRFVKGRWGTKFDCIVPAPPSVKRAFQPVVEIARALGKKLGIPVCEDAVVKAKTTDQMKNVPRSERDKLLKEAIRKGKSDVKGKRILLVDDLCESGATLRRTADVLLKDGGAKSVYAVVMTRTK